MRIYLGRSEELKTPSLLDANRGRRALVMGKIVVRGGERRDTRAWVGGRRRMTRRKD